GTKQSETSSRPKSSLFLYFIFSRLAASERSSGTGTTLPRVSEVMEHKLASAEKKLVQRRRLEGENGGWKEFLSSSGFGLSVGDPSQRSDDVLVAFLSTFKKKEDLQVR
ncbi:unnamed protein product, partial [Brassica rapa subsp. narinosa]